MNTNPRIVAVLQFIAFEVVVLAGLVIGFMWFVNPHLPWEADPDLNPDKNHIHIDWAVWVHGVRRDYSHDKYMSGLSTDDASHDEEAEYLHKYLHLHDNVSHVVHRHAPGLMLLDFMESLGFVSDPASGCLTVPDDDTYCNGEGLHVWRMIINEREEPFNLTRDFNDLDKVLLTYGASDDDIVEQWSWMTDDACRYSKACPWRGAPPEENCIADPAIPCVADLEDDFS